MLDVAADERSAERRVFGQEAIDLRQGRVELLREASEKRERRGGRGRRRGRESGEKGFEDDGMLGAKKRVEKLHGGDGDSGGVAVDAVKESGEEDRLVGGFAAEKANEELDEGRRGRGEKEREKESRNASAGDDSLVAASEIK